MRYYGYMHKDKSVHVKKLLSSGDLQDAMNSDFVDYIYGPFEAESLKEAKSIIYEYFNVG